MQTPGQPGGLGGQRGRGLADQRGRPRTPAKLGIDGSRGGLLSCLQAYGREPYGRVYQHYMAAHKKGPELLSAQL